MTGVGSNLALLVCDIDGTLVRPDKSLSDAVVAAVRRWTGAGLAATLISARPPSGMIWLAERLALTGPLGAFNGGTVVQATGTVVSAVHLADEVAARALAMVDVAGVDPWVFARGRWYARTQAGEHVRREKLSANIDPIIVDDFEGALADVDKIVGVCDDHARLAALDTEVAAALGNAAAVERSQPYYLDVTARAANKGDGVAALAAAMGVDLARTAVIGDQRNDLPMFARAGLAIAMGNAPDEVQAAAAWVTRTSADDGVAAAIDRLLGERR